MKAGNVVVSLVYSYFKICYDNRDKTFEYYVVNFTHERLIYWNFVIRNVFVISEYF